eukprot:3743492-Ditylum_brightwellii.AAC.1
MSQAFGELCHTIVKKGATLCKEIEGALHAELQSEVYLLTQIIPDLKEVINQETGHEEALDDTNSETRQA